jgi:hypothetical protein
MTSRASLLLCVCVFLDSERCVAVPVPMNGPNRADLEKRVIIALEQNNDTALRQLEKDIARFDGPTRADLRFRITDKVVEFEFRGVFPFGQTQPESLEYLISLDPHQNHETLLAVKEDEMARLRQFRGLFQNSRGDNKTRLLDSRLCWMEGRNMRQIKLDEILQPELPSVRIDFIKQIEIMEHGLGGNLNVKGQRAVLPQESAEGRMIIVVPRGR